MSGVRQRWYDVHGRYPNDEDITKMCDDFVPMQLDCLKNYTDLLPGVPEAVNKLRKDYNMKIGCTTGFYKAMVDILLEDAAKQGYVPDASVAGDEVINGSRPKPFMLYRNLDLMDVSPVQAVVKVDDTVSGIGEAQEAGCWGVGVARYSNYMDINSFEEEAQLDDAEIQRRLKKTRDILVKSGAHYVIDSIVDLPEVVDDINRRLANGETPA